MRASVRDRFGAGAAGCGVLRRAGADLAAPSARAPAVGCAARSRRDPAEAAQVERAEDLHGELGRRLGPAPAHAHPQAVHPHALGEVDAVASAGALWLVTEARSGGGRGLVRWRPRIPRPEAVTLLDGTAYDVERVAPYGDDGALAGVIRRSDGARLLLRVTLDASGVGTAEPVDAGPGSPELRDALLLP